MIPPSKIARLKRAAETVEAAGHLLELEPRYVHELANAITDLAERCQGAQGLIDVLERQVDELTGQRDAFAEQVTALQGALRRRRARERERRKGKR